MSYILDSGFIYAQLNDKDWWHEQVSKIVPLAEREIIYLPIPAITEVCYLMLHDLGVAATSDFITSLADTSLILEAPQPEDFLRSAEILRKYSDAKIDFVDVCIVATAERLNITKILTVDRRHFQMFRPRHCEAFEILP